VVISSDKKIVRALDVSLLEKDFFCPESRHMLADLGLDRHEALSLLAGHKSQAKYGYTLSPETVTHILQLADESGPKHVLHGLVEAPFFLLKASWLYEHAPYFSFAGGNQRDLDAFVKKFAHEYATQYLHNRVTAKSWQKLQNPWRVVTVTFWDNQVIDPLVLVDKARLKNLEGLELSVDFHPFNYRKLLPEEISSQRRQQIKEACSRAGLKIDIHSPIVGPYSPFPDPKRGTQLFYDPLHCLALQHETLQLARDVGAGSVVVHLIDPTRPEKMAELVFMARECGVRVTFENYCQTAEAQSAELFLGCLDKILVMIPEDVKARNFGVTLDLGHLNIEGEDPLVGAEKIGLWCRSKKVWLRLHATDNYGKLLFHPPAYSADVHSNVSGRGINNRAVIRMLRSMGHRFAVVAEQIEPLSREDILLIHEAQTVPVEKPYEACVAEGRQLISLSGFEPLLTPSVIDKDAYLFLAYIAGVPALKEYLVLRKIQDHKHLSVEEAKKISKDFMRMPLKFRKDLIEYIDDLLLPIQSEQGVLQKSDLDLICQNISGALFGTLNNEHLSRIFSESRVYRKGDIICHQNLPGQEMYYIKEGEVTVLMEDTPVATLRPGEIFGEISLFYNIDRTATIVAATDSTKIGVLTREGFETLLRTSEPHSHDLIYRLYNILPERLRNLNDKYRTAFNALYLFPEADKLRERIPRSTHTHAVDLEPRVDFLPKFSEEEALTVFNEIRLFDAGQLVFAEGDRGDGAYMIVEGSVKAVTLSEHLDEITFGVLHPGEIFGEMALIDDKPRSANIVTLTPCKLGFVKREDFERHIETRSNLAFRLMAFICLSLFKRILTLDKVYSDLKGSLA